MTKEASAKANEVCPEGNERLSLRSGRFFFTRYLRPYVTAKVPAHSAAPMAMPFQSSLAMAMARVAAGMAAKATSVEVRTALRLPDTSIFSS